MRVPFVISILVLTGCGVPSVYGKKPKSSPADDAVVQLWVESIRAHGESGDWILTRNYALVGDLIVALSFHEESLSHAAIYDKERDMVIEATSPNVQAVSLENFVRRYKRVILARPNWLSHDQQVASMHRARALVGEPYDWAGLVGIDDGGRYYCSEFVLVVADQEGVIDRPVWVTPAGLLDVAHVIFDGGVRDDARTKTLAMSRMRRRRAVSHRRTESPRRTVRPPTTIAGSATGHRSQLEPVWP
ncbi:MAG: hypothetical protein KJO07_06345 [Deltaproteobacteria bacterium]|nr:hypothetical protein [Deltaproteobacteria bacterium]